MDEKSDLEKTLNNQKINYETLWRGIIRPPRDSYSLEELGPESFNFMQKECVREDYTLMSKTGYLISCSFYRFSPSNRTPYIRPVVIYLHGNSSSRLEGKRMMKYLFSKNIDIFTFDFSGSGMSEGEFISLGYHEQNDVKTVVDFVEKLPGVGRIGLWGRSMGAATTMMYAHQDERIKAICVDSPFYNFRELAKELCYKEKGVPGFLVDTALFFVKKTVKSKNNLEIDKLKPIDYADATTCPAIFIHAMKDELIPHTHSVKLFEKYAGKKSLNIVEGKHNSVRQKHIIDKVIKFFEENLFEGEKGEELTFD